MINAEDIKAVATPQSVARYFLGTPFKERNDILWYKSPFREETEPSFEVTSQGMHDFGSDEHYDVISFTQKICLCSFSQACETLAKLYGITENEYENERVRRYLREQRQTRERYKHKVECWFISFMNFIEKLWQENEECIKALTYYKDSLEILYERQIFLGCLREDILEIDTFEDKEKLRNEVIKKGLPKWMKGHKECTLILAS